MDRLLGVTAGLAVLLSSALGWAAEAGSEERPIVGAIRWDAWYGQTGPVKEVERTMGPRKSHFRLPFFAKVLADDKVGLDGSSQETMEKEIAYATGRQHCRPCFIVRWPGLNDSSMIA
jgi:hypothetical protein